MNGNHGMSLLVSAVFIYAGIANARPGTEVESAAISGRVLDAFSGIPIQGAMVYILETKTMSAVPLNDSALTDAAGKFRFINLVPIEDIGYGYVLRVKAQGYGYTQTNLLQVSTGQELIRDFNLERILSLSLAVRDSADKAALSSGAHVTLLPPGNKSRIHAVETDSQGRVGFTGLTAGTVMLTIAAKGYLTRVMSRAMDESIWDDTVSAALRKDSAGESRSVQGVLKSRSGKTVSGYLFFFQCQDTAGTAYLYTTSGTDGRFRFEGVPGVCATGAYFSYPDSASITLTGTSTEADFIVPDPPILEVRPIRAAPAKAAAWTRWFRDFNVLGRKRR